MSTQRLGYFLSIGGHKVQMCKAIQYYGSVQSRTMGGDWLHIYLAEARLTADSMRGVGWERYGTDIHMLTINQKNLLGQNFNAPKKAPNKGILSLWLLLPKSGV